MLINKKVALKSNKKNMYKIKINKDTLGKYTIYNSIIEVYNNSKKLYEVEAARNMLHEKDAKEIAELVIEEIKEQNSIK